VSGGEAENPMKPTTTAVKNLLATGQFVIAELYSLTPANSGSPLRYTSADIDIAWSGTTWSSRGPRISRGLVHFKLGLDVDTLELFVAPKQAPDPEPDLIGGMPWLAAVRGGALDGAVCEVDFALLPSWQSPVVGTVVWFLGRVAEVEAGRSLATVKVNSHLELLGVNFPRNLYQASCRHTLFDAGCQLIAGNFAVSGIVGTGSTQAAINAPGLSAPGSGSFALGRLAMTSGANAGFARMVSGYAGGSFSLVGPLPFPPAPGDAFTVYPGCDKQLATCQAFGNTANFGGFPYIPVPETAV